MVVAGINYRFSNREPLTMCLDPSGGLGTFSTKARFEELPVEKSCCDLDVGDAPMTQEFIPGQ